MISDDETNSDVSDLPPIVRTALVRFTRKLGRDRDDWQVAVRMEDFLAPDLSVWEDACLQLILAIDLRMWLRAPQRSAEAAPPVEYFVIPDPVFGACPPVAMRAPRG